MKKLAMAAAVGVVMAPSLAQANDWTGGYVGAQLGYGDVSTSPSVGSGSGGIGGLVIGGDYDYGNWVLGAGLDYDWASISLGNGLKLKDVFRAKARLGYDLGTTLLYGSLGYARANVDPLGRDDGYFGGVGAEWWDGVNPWAVGGELLYHEFKDFKGTGVKAKATTLEVRVMYRF